MSDLTIAALIRFVLATLAGATLIQISPLKIDPWTWLGRKIGRALNGEVMDELKNLKGRMESMEAQNEQDKMDASRIRILRFGDECKRDVPHSEEHFNEVLDDIDRYESYCNSHPEYKNAKAVLTIAKIKEIYGRRLESGDFL